MSQAAHWATPLIGLPFRRGAAGPDAFDAWALVQHVLAMQYGSALPFTPEEDAEWAPQRVSRDGDLVFMEGPEGRHCGVVIAIERDLRVLHAVDGVGVCVQPVDEVRRWGYRSIAFWRRKP